MNKNRLLDLIDTVKNVPAKAFEMRCFKQETDCGTIGCAAWHYMKRFPRRGMRPINGGYPRDAEGRYASAAMENHFRISGRDSYRIFYGRGRGSAAKKSVIRTIKAVIKEGEAANASTK